ncbi:glycine betaine ABC transporter substrate-binding protein [Jeotgalibaca sp. MA1X17-3]|uniref:glycine betaine ABC transporter substrate-binding protein n=1 Tax=Jeotgalibaca sp. MA1X17-3 TaxID=2908211 RepID=UPI0037BE8F8A
MTINWKKIGLTAVSASALLLAACGTDSDSDTAASGEANGVSGEINLAYVAWDTEIASTNVIATVLEDYGYDTETTQLDNAIMWEAVASGDADAMVAAWLPGTHAPQFEQYGDRMVHVSTNLEGAKIGLVVPEYMDVDSIADLSDEAEQTITGIEAGAGVVAASEQALEDYENLADWNVQTSSSGAMTTQLKQAIKNEEEIVITGWSPHWMFQSYDLKYLEDAEGSFGDAETIDTFAREGLEEDMPEAYQILENFNWTTEDMESVMLDIQEGTEPKEAARTWVDANEDKVAEWTNGVGE